MNAALAFRSAVVVTASLWAFSACGSSETSTTPPTSDAATPTVAAKANGVFEIHYVTGATSADSYAEIGGFMYDGAMAELVIWDKKKTDGNCSLYQPRTPFCESCAPGQVCVDTNVCRTPPSGYDVGDITMTGLMSPSGANPLPLTAVTGSTGTNYVCTEDLPVPPCTTGATVGLSATGKGDYPAFSIQTQCIAPLVVTNSAITLQSGSAFTLTWTPSNPALPEVGLEVPCLRQRSASSTGTLARLQFRFGLPQLLREQFPLYHRCRVRAGHRSGLRAGSARRHRAETRAKWRCRSPRPSEHASSQELPVEQ